MSLPMPSNQTSKPKSFVNINNSCERPRPNDGNTTLPPELTTSSIESTSSDSTSPLLGCSRPPYVDSMAKVLQGLGLTALVS